MPQERQITLRLTETQCNQLANLLDVAVKAGGIQAAAIAVPFMSLMRTELETAIVPANTIPLPEGAPTLHRS